MGIKQLMQLLTDKAPDCYKPITLDQLSGRVLALDASIALYQFLISTQFTNKCGMGSSTGSVKQFTDANGNPTAHLIGIFNRNVQFVQHGIKPIWVFDGKPPDLKLKTLEKRKESRDKAEEAKEEAQEEGDEFKLMKMSQRTVKVTKPMVEDAKKLVKAMGMPVVQAPNEAEAFCAYLVKSGKAYATVSEDMDSLTFGSPILVRGMSSSKGASKGPDLIQIDYAKVLEQLKLTPRQFVDLCILCGCDYTNSIGGVGPVKAFKYIQEYETLDRVLDFIKREIKNQSNGKKAKFIIPDEFPFEEAREIFLNNDHPQMLQEVAEALKWTKPDEAELKDFLVTQKGFNTEKVEKGLQKIVKAIPQMGRTQVRLDTFFKSSGAPPPAKGKTPAKGSAPAATANKGKGFQKKK